MTTIPPVSSRQSALFLPSARSEDSSAFVAMAADFVEPPARVRIMPFWFWNTRMEPALIRRQIREMAAGGVGGFFLHPRQGLETPYLSAEWFERVRIAVETARQEGMEVWLYDEYPYPSGMAGGWLTADHPEFRARSLEQRVLEAQGGVALRQEFALARVVSALACPCEGGRICWERAIDVRDNFGVLLSRQLFWLWELEHCPYNQKRFMADEGRLVLEWTPPQPGEWRIFVGLEREQQDFKYYGYYFDPLCPGAAESFLRLTHARYEDAVGAEFGKTVVGFFTDETEPPEWSAQIERELLATAGIDMAQCLPALTQDDHPRAAEVRYRFRECALRLFRERWESPLAQWCAKRGLIWCAEKPTWRPAQFDDIAQPAIDAGHRRAGDRPEPLSAALRTNGRAAMAAAQHARTNEVRCECFHSMGWGATLQDQKWQIDWLAAQGVNRFTPHAFYASCAGLRKHDAAPSFFTETPAWPAYRQLADYTARLSLALSCGCEVAPIAVLHPTESLWIGTAAGQRTRADYEWLMNALMARHRMFHPVDAHSLLRARVAEGALRVGAATYRLLLVPALAAADHATQAAIEAACSAGVTVIMGQPHTGENAKPVWKSGKPVPSQPMRSETDALLNRPHKIARMAGITLVSTQAQWLQQIDACLPAELEVLTPEGASAESVWSLVRGEGRERLVFLANTAAVEQQLYLRLPDAALHWSQWLLETGAISRSVRRAGSGHASLLLPPYGSALLVGTQEEILFAKDVPAVAPQICDIPLDGVWQLQLDRPNALRLNRWEAAGVPAAGFVSVEAVPVRYYDKAAEQWRQSFAIAEDGSAVYRRTITCRAVPEDLALLMENDAIGGEWVLKVNGHVIPANAFKAAQIYGGDRRVCSLSSYFHTGENTLTLHVRGADTGGGLLTPLHLIGSFALTGGDRRELDHLPAQVAFGQLADAGLPHFSGVAQYVRRVRFPMLKPGSELRLPDESGKGVALGNVVSLSINGQGLGTRPWSPYLWRLPFALEGEAEVRIAITNTLLPFLEGQRETPFPAL